MKVLFITPGPTGISPGQRFRFEHYFKFLQETHIDYEVSPFFTMDGWTIIYKEGHVLKKIACLISGLFKRLLLLFKLTNFDVIYIYREVAPLGPPVFEWLIRKLHKKKIIYDFDDAIWIPLSSTANPYSAKIKCTWKVSKICSWSNIVTVGNQFLADYSKQYCKDTRIIPTVVDTENSHNLLKNQTELPLTIGWTGTFTNFIHLPIVIKAINDLHQKYSFNFLIIADKDPNLSDIKYTFIKWTKQNEIYDLLKMNIGIMPLINTDVQLGKCAFKAIQYMSLGIPAVVTPIGANCEIVENGITGFWAETYKDWYDQLEKLILNTDLRSKMGKLAQERIINSYSVTSTRNSFLDLFQTTLSQ